MSPANSSQVSAVAAASVQTPACCGEPSRMITAPHAPSARFGSADFVSTPANIHVWASYWRRHSSLMLYGLPPHEPSTVPDNDDPSLDPLISTGWPPAKVNCPPTAVGVGPPMLESFDRN